MSEQARLFVAADVPPDARAAIAAWGRQVAGERAELRLVDADALHLTLAFLGDRPLGDVEALARLLPAVIDGAVAPTTGAPLWLAPRRPHVLTLAMDDPAGALGALHRRVAAALQDTLGVDAESRAFRPHVTVARVRRGAHVRVDELPAPARVRFGVPSVTLYRSRLGRGGAQYEPLAQAAVPPPG